MRDPVGPVRHVLADHLALRPDLAFPPTESPGVDRGHRLWLRVHGHDRCVRRSGPRGHPRRPRAFPRRAGRARSETPEPAEGTGTASATGATQLAPAIAGTDDSAGRVRPTTSRSASFPVPTRSSGRASPGAVSLEPPLVPCGSVCFGDRALLPRLRGGKRPDLHLLPEVRQAASALAVSRSGRSPASNPPRALRSCPGPAAGWLSTGGPVVPSPTGARSRAAGGRDR